MTGSAVQTPALLGATDYAGVFAALPTAYLVLTPDLVIADANDAYLQLLGRIREDLIGREVFEAFPPTPDALDEQGRNPLQLSFEQARDTGRSDAMPLLSYAVFDPASGHPGLVERRDASIDTDKNEDDIALLVLRVREP